ncbi:MAG TPA: hypothetical protein VD994_07575 [Prosthecobacter sp.]|nr:hypothetical protein [Prosthecobacter sp.]
MKVFKINDCDWYMANTLDEAVALAIAETGLPRDEAVDDPRELSEEAMNRLQFVNPDGSKWSFAVELQNRIQAGMKPGFFATTEY